MRKIFLILTVCSTMLISCDAKQPAADSGSDPKMLNGTWEVVHMTKSRLGLNELYPDKKPFLTFNVKESKVSGNTGCNSFTGNISSMSNGKIRFEEAMAMTKMFCQGEGEPVFLKNMKVVEGFKFSDDGKTLHLTEEGGIDAMRLTKK